MKQVTETLVKRHETPFEQVAKLLPSWMEPDLPRKWTRVGSVLVIQIPGTLENYAQEIGEAYATLPGISSVVAKAKIAGELRQPVQVRLLYGNNTETTVTEHGIRYRLDVSKLMWSAGNVGWRAGPRGSPGVKKIYEFQKPQVILDCFAGIGYFTLQLARAYPDARVVAIDKNPESVQYLRQNIELNRFENIEVVHEDCRNVHQKADVVHLGYIGDTLRFLPHASAQLHNGGVLILHDVFRRSEYHVKRSSEWAAVPERLRQELEQETPGLRVMRVARVKNFGPGTAHLAIRLEKS